LHTGADSLALILTEMLAGLVPDAKIVRQAAGPALTTHLGLGAVGVCALLATT
jgi:fatty acid-binding protein DegV